MFIYIHDEPNYRNCRQTIMGFFKLGMKIVSNLINI